MYFEASLHTVFWYLKVNAIVMEPGLLLLVRVEGLVKLQDF